MSEGFPLAITSTLKVELSPTLVSVRPSVTLSPVRRTWYGDWPTAGMEWKMILVLIDCHVAKQRCRCGYIHVHVHVTTRYCNSLHLCGLSLACTVVLPLDSRDLTSTSDTSTPTELTLVKAWPPGRMPTTPTLKGVGGTGTIAAYMPTPTGNGLRGKSWLPSLLSILAEVRLAPWSILSSRVRTSPITYSVLVSALEVMLCDSWSSFYYHEQGMPRGIG